MNETTAALDCYDTVRYVNAISKYVDDLSTWYLRRSRGRKEEKFFYTLRHALLMVSKVIAPVVPYLAEKIYRDLNLRVEVPSVHLADWPETKQLTDDETKLLVEMKKVRDLASIGMALRKEANIPVRQPLSSFRARTIITQASAQILKEELNVIDVVINLQEGKDAKLDTKLTPELRVAGLVRSLERAIQELRKKQGLAVGEMAELVWSSEDAELKRAIGAVNCEKTYLKNIREDASAAETVTVDGKSIKLGLKK